MSLQISLNNISKSFGNQRVLSDINFDIDSGELLVVLGQSGSGKSTLLRIIAGLDSPDSGEILINGKSVLDVPAQKRRFGVVFQEHALFQRMTVEENVAFGLKIRNISKSLIDKTVNEMLELIKLESHRKKYPSQLSGGQRQRVALARALAYEPEAMLFDEPFSALDAATRLELRREVRSLLRKMNVPVFFITHDQEEALELADRVIVLNHGHIEQAGSPYEVYNHPANEFVASFLGAANILFGRWIDGKVRIGSLSLMPPPDAPSLSERQPVKIVFRPEDVVINFNPQLMGTSYILGRAEVEDKSYIGHGERLTLRLPLWKSQLTAAGGHLNSDSTLFSSFDDAISTDSQIVVSRNRWDADEMELSPGDPVVVGLKGYRLLPHYPLTYESAAEYA